MCGKKLSDATYQLWRRIFALGLIGLLTIGSCLIYAALPDERLDSKTSVELPKDVGFRQQLNTKVPLDVTFVNAEGQRTPLSAVASHGKPIILNLVYFQCPMLCHMSSDGLVRTLNTMRLRAGNDFHVITISFNPGEGTTHAQAAKQTIVSRYDGTAAGWHFFTGDQAAIDRITEAVGFRYAYDDVSGQYAHAAGVVLLTPEGRISRYISGVDYAARDLRLSLVEASQNQIGSLTDQAMLLCFRYDPLTGKYGLAINRAIQVAGLLTIVAVVGSIAWAVQHTPTSCSPSVIDAPEAMEKA